jgi:hypothetical protein
MSTNDLRRRRFLRGAAGGALVSVALPRLAPMLDGRGEAWAAGGGRPIRYVTWGFGNGVVTARWNPASAGQGAAWQLPASFAPLAPWKAYLSVVTGVSVSGAGAHGTGNIVYLSGTPCSRGGGPPIPTLDQQIAAQTKLSTPIKSIEVGLTDNQDDRTLGHLYWSHNGPSSPNPPAFNPAEIFNRLFGPTAPGAKIGATGGAAAGPDPAAAKAADTIRSLRKSVLDFVVEDSARLRAALPAADKLRLDQHLEGVREIERRLAAAPVLPAASGAGCRNPGAAAFGAAATPKSFPQATETNKAMAKLVALAFACDLTRVVTYQTTQAASRATWPDLGISNWHGTSHDGTAAGQDKIQRVVMQHMEWLKVLVEELHRTPDGAGNLLDNLALLTVNDVGQGWTHQSTEMPTLIVGKAGGGLKGDVSYRLGGWCARVGLTLAHAVGVKLAKFGSGAQAATEPIGELLG